MRVVHETIDEDLTPFGLIATNILNRRINHIKIQSTPRNTLKAKAHIFYNIIWTGRDESTQFTSLVARHA